MVFVLYKSIVEKIANQTRDIEKIYRLVKFYSVFFSCGFVLRRL